jgi:hypothetical protein
LDFLGEVGGVREGLSMALSMSRKKRQLRLLRGDAGVLGDAQSSVLIVFVGDNGGVRKPVWYEDASSPVSFMSKLASR